MSQIFQVQAMIEKVETMSNGLRLKIDTQETLTPDAMFRLMELHQQLGYFTFNVHQVEVDDLLDLPPIKKIGNKKSKSQTLRQVFFRMWEKNNQGIEDKDDFYNYMMDKLIEFYKEKIED